MREIVIGKREEGQRFDKYLKKYLDGAGSGFIYKMLRKKNITLNGKKASGSEIISEGDSVKMFMSDETIEKFRTTGGDKESAGTSYAGCPDIMYDENTITAGEYVIPILYENEDEIFFNKPAGLLSQKAERDDISLADIYAGYMSMKYGNEDAGYRPGLCNRLDRNTSGVIAAGKSVTGQRRLSEMIRERSVKKFYRCIVSGKVTETTHLKGYLIKDRDANKVRIVDTAESGTDEDVQYIETILTPIETGDFYSLLSVELITGKSHQIRAHLASVGHPIVGDAKYGYRGDVRADRQMLHAYEMIFPDDAGDLSGKTITAPLPEDFERVYRHAILEFKRT